MSRGRRSVIAALLGLVLLAAGLGTGVAVVRASGRAPTCGAEQAVTHTFPAGTAWSFCWSTGVQGLLLHDVAFTDATGVRHPVLRGLNLAEMFVSYDDGSGYSTDVSGYGFQYLLPITARQCRGGTRSATPAGPDTVCTAIVDSPVAYRTDTSTATGQALSIFTVSEAAWYKYVTRYSFRDDGTITPDIGATGTLNATPSAVPEAGWPIGAGGIATAHTHAAYWRLEFGADGPGSAQTVTQVDSPDTGADLRPLRETPLGQEIETRAAAGRFWTVADPTRTAANGRHPSWQVSLDGLDHYTGPAATEPFTAWDLALTQARPCEQLLLDNIDRDCAHGLAEYLDGEPVTAPVLWARVDFHHVPRLEDTPLMSTHWQGFTVAPRDALDTNPIAPPPRGHH